MSTHTQLLLDTLSPNLPQDAKDLLNDDTWKTTALSYLDELLNSDNMETLLDTTTPMPSSSDNTQSVGIAQQIAELSNQSAIMDNNIFNKLNSNSNSNLSLVLETNTIFNESFENFDNLLILSKKLVEHNSIGNWKSLINGINTSLGLNHHKDGDGETDIKPVKYNNELSIMLQNLQGLIEILELPSITHSLIKLGQYPECIEISSLSKRLKIRYNDIEMINQIEESITFEINDMIKKLSSLLMTNIKQSSMIKVLSYLKRIINNKEQLKSIFFHSRYKFMIDEFETLIPLKQSNLIEKYLKRILEIFREYCFQTIITFDSVFDKDRQLTYVFLKSLVDKLCEILNENLPLLLENDENSACDSLLLQLIYCCQSLSRVGGDFTACVLQQLTPTIEQERLLTIVKKQKELVRSLNRV